MLHRRAFLLLTSAFAGAFSLSGLLTGRKAAFAQGTDRPNAFVKATGDKLVAVVNGPGSAEAKRRELTTIIAAAIDIDGVGRFCLGRFWRQASAEQQKTYLELFHKVLVTSVTAKLGEYQGVKLTVGRTRQQEEEQIVSTVVERPNNPPTTVDWVITQPQSAPRIIDVIAEGTSLRITQRSDYASYLQRNGNSIDALIGAMRQQVSQQS